jgi:hypothetical protein
MKKRVIPNAIGIISEKDRLVAKAALFLWNSESFKLHKNFKETLAGFCWHHGATTYYCMM